MGNSTFIQGLASGFTGPFWERWPFGPGYGNIMASVTRFLFVGIIFLLIILYLRLLFGPKGWFRDKELDREAEAARQADRQAALADLDRRLAAGEIDQALHARERDRLK